MTNGTSATDGMLARLRANRESLVGHIACPHGPAICGSCARDLMHAMAQLAAGVFSQPPSPRANAELTALRRVDQQLAAALATLDAIADHAPMHVADWPRSSERTALSDLLSRVRFGAQFLSDEIEALGSNRGGRDVDDRIGKAVSALAVIYQHMTGCWPTHVQDPGDGAPTSSFNRLVNAFFSATYPAAEIPWSAIREQMRATCDARVEVDVARPEGDRP